MAQTNFSKVDEYGFQRPKNFNYEIYGDFMSNYYRVLARRSKRWEELKDSLLLLATKDEEATFWLLKVLVEKILPQYYIKTMSGLLTDLAVLDELIKMQDPIVYRHIQDIGMPWAVTTTKWIWDCLFYEGSKILFRVAITLIKTHRDRILKARDLSELVVSFKSMAESQNVINCHKFITDIFKIPGSFSKKTLEKLRLKHLQQ
ncbi:hypothetical protein Trydic_g8241 [Trypoxylus dichotomus]